MNWPLYLTAMKKMVYTPGPSQLYFTAEEHVKQALRENIPALSHRSRAFQSLFQEAAESLRNLLEIPEAFSIYFTGSATEIWDRLIENCVTHESCHLVNGAFSKRFGEQARALGRETHVWEVPQGTAHPIEQMLMPESCELIALTHNETSTGVSMRMEDLSKIRTAFPDQLIAIDAVSSLPYPQFDWSTMDSTYFSVQKGFGLPAGLGVWIVNERCHDKAQERSDAGYSIGSYHNLLSLREKAQKNQTPETPNVLGIYLLAKVAQDMLGKGMDMIRRETNYKAAFLYGCFERWDGFQPFVSEGPNRSKTVLVVETERPSAQWVQMLSEKGFVVGQGYGPLKDHQLRIANFPTHSKEGVELLADTIESLL